VKLGNIDVVRQISEGVYCNVKQMIPVARS